MKKLIAATEKIREFLNRYRDDSERIVSLTIVIVPLSLAIVLLVCRQLHLRSLALLCMVLLVIALLFSVALTRKCWKMILHLLFVSVISIALALTVYTKFIAVSDTLTYGWGFYSIFVCFYLILWALSSLIADKDIAKISNSVVSTIITILTTIVNFIILLQSESSFLGVPENILAEFESTGYSFRTILLVMFNMLILPILLNCQITKLEVRDYYETQSHFSKDN